MFKLFKSDKDKKLEAIRKQILLWHHACMLGVDENLLKEPRPQIGAILFFLGSVDSLCQAYAINDDKVFADLGIELLEIMGFKKEIIILISMNFYTRRPDNEFALQANVEGGRKITEFLFKENTIAPLAFGAFVSEWAQKPDLCPDDMPLLSTLPCNKKQCKEEFGIDITDQALEDHNFKINSCGWKKITVDGKSYFENPEKDIWEILEGECAGEQLFSWDAAIRETKKAGKRIPTKKEFTEILKTKEDMSNVIFTGFCFGDGSFCRHTPNMSFWSSTESDDSAWKQNLYSSDSVITQDICYKAAGFSVRCIKD